MKKLAAVVFFIFFLIGSAAHGDIADLTVLIEGVKEIAAPGIPGPLCVYGNSAFVVGCGRSGKGVEAPVAGAAKIDKGRVLIFGHDGYFGYDTLSAADTGRLMLNAIRWATDGKLGARVAVHASAGVLNYLKENGVDAEALDGAQWYSRLNDYDLLCSTPWDFDFSAIESVQRYIKNGGGYIGAALGWGYLQLNPGKTIQELPGNLLLAEHGLMWADGMLERTTQLGFEISAPPADCHSLTALETVDKCVSSKSCSETSMAQAVDTIARAATTLQSNDRLFLPKLHSFRKKLGNSAVYPTKKTPITSAQPVERLLLTLEMQANPAKAHPAAPDFPGSVSKDIQRIAKRLTIDTSVPGWHGTGLYAAPGEVITVAAEDLGDTGMQVRIGCHSDTLWHLDSWQRVPEICKTVVIKGEQTHIVNPFGGLIYIVVPDGCKLDKVEFMIVGAVQSPRFVLNHTGMEQWRDEIRLFAGPWAELETDKVVLTLPSEAIRMLDDPQSLMLFWDKVLDSCADLAGWQRERRRPERYVADRQISAGYMHSGYPIMTWLDVIHHEVDLNRLQSNADGMNWGFFHEMGHNHQSGDWTFDGTVEVTVNLFTLYTLETVCGIRSQDSRKELTAEGMAEAYKKYVESGKSFETWKSNPFLALAMYVMIKDQFGWDAFKKVFAEYRDLPNSERPRTDDEKRDQWLVRLSRTVGKDLGEFFEKWGVPTSKEARDSLSDLPVWISPIFEVEQ